MVLSWLRLGGLDAWLLLRLLEMCLVWQIFTISSGKMPWLFHNFLREYFLICLPIFHKIFSMVFQCVPSTALTSDLSATSDDLKFL